MSFQECGGFWIISDNQIICWVNFIDLHVQPDPNISHYMYRENFECVMQDLYLNVEKTHKGEN